jgi:hypothetical protein
MELKDLFKGLLGAFPVISLIISVIGACISFYYFRKSKEHAETVLLNNYINEAAREFEKKGTPVNYIKSIVLPDNKKEIIWKNCHLLHKGRLPDRLFSDIPPPSLPSMFSIGEYKPVMKALGTGQHEDRTVKSISEETGIAKGEVEKALRWFFDNGLAQKRTAKDGTYWSLTEKGWGVY